MINQTMTRQDWAILLFLSVLWGGSFFFIEIALDSVQPLTLVLIRVSIAAALLWLFVALRRQRVALTGEAMAAYVVLALLNNVIPFILFVWAQQEITGGLASILNATTPIWGVLVAHLLTADEKARPHKIFGVLLGFGGVAVMIGPGLVGHGRAIPQLECLAATLCYALAGVWARRFRPMGCRRSRSPPASSAPRRW